jgi:hypothetical protein
MMRGEIFTEFVEFVAERFGPEAAGRVTTPGGRRAGAHYEASGRYDADELIHMVDRLSEARAESRASVLVAFGRHLFRSFAALYPGYLDRAGSALAFLESIDTAVHGQLQKLYPDGDFPEIRCTPVVPDGLELRYRSTRPLGDLAEGLIRECVDHFGDGVRVDREDLAGVHGTAVRFVLLPS